MEGTNFKYLSKIDMVDLLVLSHQSLQCHNEQQFMAFVSNLKRLFGFDHVVCSHGNMADAFQGPQAKIDVLNLGCPEEYMSTYFENRYHLSDKLLFASLETTAPLNWRIFDRRAGYDYPAARLARDFNMVDGWLHGTMNTGTSRCTSVSYGCHTDNPFRSRSIIRYITPFCTQAFERVLKKISSASVQNTLTPKEIEVLNWIKEGKSSWEISVILNISKRSVDFHTTNLKTKLEAVSRPQAVAIGLQRGIISF